jgi:DNA-directed RNA polymerase specialized sigma24 family protein
VGDWVSPKEEWDLTKDAFYKLLLWLDSDHERAGEKYEQIRRRLNKYFEWQGCAYPEEQTDQTINRVAKKLGEGVEVLAADPFRYFSGVARNVVKEYWRHPERAKTEMQDLRSLKYDDQESAGSRKVDTERKLECLEECLMSLPTEHRELITEYYKEEKQAKIRTRKRLAERLGIPLNALRIRSCRIRENLERCVTTCLGESTGELK